MSPDHAAQQQAAQQQAKQQQAEQQTRTALAWIDQPSPAGRWGSPAELAIPLADRGLLLADGVFETVLLLNGSPQWLEEHLQRWQRGAELLGMAPPPACAVVRPLIQEAMQRSGIRSGALRLNWSRGCAGRGIAIPAVPATPHRFWLQVSPHTPDFQPWRVIVSATERRSTTSLLSRCKTFSYGAAIQARRQAQHAGADDAVLLNDAGELCCGTTTNLLVRTPSGWCTPPLGSGCLPGIMRQRALDLGLVREQSLHQEDLLTSAGALLINSLGCRLISHLGEVPLPLAPDDANAKTAPIAAAIAERFWRRLLPAEPVSEAA